MPYRRSWSSPAPIPQWATRRAGWPHYYDVLGADAFGNFRSLLEDVTLNPLMGEFLSMLANDKGDATRDPDENYAREVMQLFTIGLYQLNPDGTQKLDATGQPIPTYSNLDVMGLAKVLTGFSWNIPGDASDNAWYNCCVYVGPGHGEDLLPMQSFPSHHSTAEKDFLGVTIAASPNPDPAGDLKIALDTLFNHPNLPPFFCKQLIQHLVTSNPTPPMSLVWQRSSSITAAASVEICRRSSRPSCWMMRRATPLPPQAIRSSAKCRSH